jgi:hypothetical protein
MVSGWTKQFIEGEGGTETVRRAHAHVQGHPGGPEILHALRARHPAAGGDAGDRDRHLPRLSHC